MADTAEMKWYVVHTYSGYENKVKANIEKTVENTTSMQGLIGSVEIPQEEVLEIKNGKSHIVQRKRMPGYVLVHGQQALSPLRRRLCQPHGQRACDPP